jgi:hypothetical protein
MHFLRCFILAGIICLPGTKVHADFFTPQQKDAIANFGFFSLAGIAASGVVATIPAMLAHWDIGALNSLSLQSTREGLLAGILLSWVGPAASLILMGILSSACVKSTANFGAALAILSFTIGYVVTVSMTLKLAVNWQDIDAQLPEVITYSGGRNPKKELYGAWIANSVILGLPYTISILTALGWAGLQLKTLVSHWLVMRAVEPNRATQVSQEATAADTAVDIAPAIHREPNFEESQASLRLQFAAWLNSGNGRAAVGVPVGVVPVGVISESQGNVPVVGLALGYRPTVATSTPIGTQDQSLPSVFPYGDEEDRQTYLPGRIHPLVENVEINGETTEN